MITDRSSLLSVDRVIVPRALAEAVQQHLRKAGNAGNEGVAFWAGNLNGAVAIVTAAFMPPQSAGQLGDGSAVVVFGEALFEMNVWLHQRGLTLLAQIHSHPGIAYHSETDDLHAIMTQIGGLSIVVPDFAQGAFSLDEVAVYRLMGPATWAELEANEIHSLITLVD